MSHGHLRLMSISGRADELQGGKAGAGEGGRGPARQVHAAEAQEQERRWRLPGHRLQRAGE
jgi:hypothetical protein